jgi:hypothetical protein
MARWLFLILLVLNLVLFIWGYQRPQPQEEPLAPLPEGVPTIRLLTELEAQETGSEPESSAREPAEHGEYEVPGRQSRTGPTDESIQAESSVVAQEDALLDGAGAGAISMDIPHASRVTGQDSEAPGVEDGRKCVRLGPIKQRTAATDLISELSGLGHDASLQVEIDQWESGFWVLIPAGSEDPDFVVANLELAGIQDLWQFTKGDLRGAVSLGLYSDREKAQERLQVLADKGFDAEVRPRTVEVSTYWVRSLFPKDDSNSVLEPVYNKFPWLGYPPMECGEIATP